MTRFFTLLFALLMLMAAPAFAGDPFTVGGVKVDATAKTAIEAQTVAIQDGQMRAAQALIARLTLESERAAKPTPELTQDVVGRMIRALEVGQEKRSANRYLGEITIAFNPSQVQQYLRAAELTMVSSQARERLVIVRGATGLRGAMGGGDTLLAAMSDPRLSFALTPLRAATQADIDFLPPELLDADLAALAGKYGLSQILIIDPQGTGMANVTDISTESGTRQSFYVTGGLSNTDLADRIVARLEADWKQATAVSSGEIISTPVSVLYNSHSAWLSLQQAINTSAQIKGARLDALSKDGALMTISYGGDIDRLATELRFKGVAVEQDPQMGLVFRSSR